MQEILKFLGSFYKKCCHYLKIHIWSGRSSLSPDKYLKCHLCYYTHASGMWECMTKRGDEAG